MGPRRVVQNALPVLEVRYEIILVEPFREPAGIRVLGKWTPSRDLLSKRKIFS
jgi:hypothetical protein